MVGRLLHSTLAALRDFCLRFRHVQVRDSSCLSILEGRALSLPRQLLGLAEEAQVRFKVRLPFSAFASVRRLQVQIAGVPPRTNVDLPACAEVRHGRSQGRPALTSHVWEIIQSTRGKHIDVLVRLPMPVLAEFEAIEFEILDQHGERRLARFLCEILDECRAQRLRLRELELVAPRFWIQSGTHRHEGELVAETSDFVSPEGLVQGSGLSAFMSPCRTNLSWYLVKGYERKLLEDQPVVLGSGPMRIKPNPIAVQDRRLFPKAGLYRLVGVIAGRDIADFCFRIVSYPEWLQQLRLERITVRTETVDGRSKLEPGAMHWGTHAAFQATVFIDTNIPAPNSPVRCTARLTHGRSVLRTEEFTVRLIQASQPVPLERFPLAELGELALEKQVRLTLTIAINDELRAKWPITILPSERVSDFEGRLKYDPRSCPADEEAYEDILNGLRVEDAPSRKPVV